MVFLSVQVYLRRGEPIDILFVEIVTFNLKTVYRVVQKSVRFCSKYWPTHFNRVQIRPRKIGTVENVPRSVPPRLANTLENREIVATILSRSIFTHDIVT